VERSGASSAVPRQFKCFSIPAKSANMKTKVKLIKKEDRNAPESPVKADAGPDPKEWSTAVKSWVSEFQNDRAVESLAGFDSLFDDSKP
jgi:hypothetical protein